MGESNEAGENVVAFAMNHNMRVVNTYFEKAEREEEREKKFLFKVEQNGKYNTSEFAITST